MENTDTTKPLKINLPVTSLITAIICSLVFFIIQLIGIFHHEPWMDEFQAFQIAMNSHSLSNLFYNMRYEGHPAIWYLVLYAITRFSHNIVAMQLAHIIIATAAVFILFRYAPFSLIEKILISLGYFVFYEYAQISRCYVIGVFAVMTICAILGEKYYRKKLSGHPPLVPSMLFWIAFFLVVLANSSTYGLLISAVLAFYLILILWHERAIILPDIKLKMALACSIVIVLLGWGAAIMMMLPKPDSFINSSFPRGFDLSFLNAVLQQPLMAYFPMPMSTDVACWNTSFVFNVPPPFYANASLVFALLIAFIFVKKPVICFLYLVFMLILGCFLLYFPHWWVAPRYYGHFFIAVLICYWLEKYIPPTKTWFGLVPDHLVYPLTPVAHNISKFIFYLIVVSQASMGIYFYCMDFKYTFSTTPTVGEYIIQNHLNRYPIIGTDDVYVLPFSYYTNQPVFTFERDDTSRFVIYDNKKKGSIDSAGFRRDILTVINTSKTDTALLCLSSLPKVDAKDQATLAHGEGYLFNNCHFKLINKITTPQMIGDFNPCLFLVWKK